MSHHGKNLFWRENGPLNVARASLTQGRFYIAGPVSESVEQVERQLLAFNLRMVEMDLRFQLLEASSYNGTLLWKITNYSKRKADAVAGTTLSLYSQPFYTDRHGYKMCGRVYLNGDGMGTNFSCSNRTQKKLKKSEEQRQKLLASKTTRLMARNVQRNKRPNKKHCSFKR